MLLQYDQAPRNLVKLVHEYRDRVYIRKDIILKLSEYGELKIIDDMVGKGLMTRFEEPWGNKTIIKYKLSEKGREILNEVLEPYEALFPRSEMNKSSSWGG
jgi:DNA-binding PadR family transcriptional regulator